MYLPFIENTAILVALISLYSLIGRLRTRDRRWPQILSGLLFGAVAVAGMTFRIEYQPGVFYDGRSVVMSLAGLFGGGLPAVVAMVVAGAYRAYLGGAGMWAGLASLAAPALLALGFRRFLANRPENIKLLSLYGLGIATSLLVLAAQLLLPWPQGLRVISDLWLPILLTFPVATFLAGLLLQTEQRRIKAEKDLVWDRNLLTMIMENLPDRIYFKDREGRYIRTSRSHAMERGLSDPSEEIGKTDADFSGPEHARKAAEDERRIIQTGEPLVEMEERVTYRDRPDAWHITTKMPLRSRAGQIIGTFGISHDITARRAAERRAQESANLLDAIMESSPDSIFVKDTSLRMVLCNASLARAIGKTPQETYGKTDSENGWSADLVESWEKGDRIVLDGGTVQVTDELSEVEGEVHYYDTRKFPLRGADGAIIGIMGIGRDVTERHRAEAALARERRLFDLLMENLPDYIYLKDRQSRFIRTSRSHAIALGLHDPAEAVGKTDFDFYGPESARQEYEDEQQIIRTGTPLVDIEERETYRDRADTWVITTKMPYRDERGEIAGTFGISHDITPRKRLEEKNQQLAALVEFSDDAIVGLDPERKVTVWNRGAERMYGYSAAEAIGSLTSTFIPPELEEEARLIREKVLRGEPVEHFETTRVRKGGQRIVVSLTLSAVRDQEGKIIGMASVARDVTAEKEIQAQLNRVQRLESLATLASGVAHQFNNINTIVQGYLDLLRLDRELPPRLESYVAAGLAAVHRAGDITDRLQTMTQPAGDPLATVRLDELARSILPSFEARIEADRVRLELDLAETPPAAGESSRVKLACSSLLANALDSLLERPLKLVNLRTGRAKDSAFFEVRDTGCGIPKRDLSRLFSPFFSGKGEWAPPGSAQAGVKGLGLSLAISSAVISDYGGRIEVDSTEGTGSVFRIWLPLAK